MAPVSPRLSGLSTPQRLPASTCSCYVPPMLSSRLNLRSAPCRRGRSTSEVSSRTGYERSEPIETFEVRNGGGRPESSFGEGAGVGLPKHVLPDLAHRVARQRLGDEHPL